MPKHSHSRSVTSKRRTLAKGGRSFLSVLMSIVLVVGLCPSLAYAGEGTNSKALVLATATLAPASTPSSMKFTPVGQYKVVENTHGVTTKDDQWGTYYYYDSPEFNEGDQITLADDTGEERTYTYTRDGEDGYFIDGDERLGNEELYWLSLQEGPVKAGKAVSFELHYQDLSTTVDMTITEDPVKSIEFVPAEGRDLSVLEEADGSWDPEEAVFCYQFPEFQEGDSIVAKGEDNEIVYTYSWSDAEYAFVSGENTLDIFGLQDGQLLESAPGYATFTLEYRDPGHDNVERKFEVQVAIEHNPVKSVTFKAAGERAFTTIEGIGGDEGFACDEDGNESSYYRYNFPGFLEGDTLEVEGDEGYAGTYKYGYDEEDTPVFRTEAGNTICQGEGHGDIRDGGSDQDGDITAPKTVTFSFYYMGREFKIPVEIAVNPVKSVEFTPAPGHEFSLVAETGGYEDKLEYENGSVTRYCRYMFPGFKEGDTLAVTGDEGYGGAYVYGYDDEGTPAFRSEAGKAIYFDWNDDGIRDGGSDQTGPIDAPNEVTFSFYYMGREFKIPVAITVNPVESVEFVPADGAEFTVVEGRDGYDQPTWDEDGVETGSYFKYWFPGFHDGDRVSVKGDASIAGTYSYIGPGESTSSWLFGNDGKTIVIERDASDQFEDVSAESGEPINFTLSYMGRTFTVPVKVVENPVKSISFIPVDDEEFTITEGIGYTEETLTNDDGEQITFLRYSFPGFREGDSVVVEGSNGDKVTYVYGYDSEDNPAFRNGDDVFAVSSEGSDQVGEVACGETITFVFYYEGRTFTVPVKVVENPVSSIEFKPKSRYEVEENITSNMIDMDGVVFWYSFPGFNEGDVLTVYRGEVPTDYTYQRRSGEDGYAAPAFVSAAGETIDVDADLDQSESDPWVLVDGQDERTYQEGGIIECEGRSCRVPVTLIRNTVAEIRFEPAGDGHSVIEGLNGRWVENDENHPDPYFAYDPPSFRQGDKLTVVSSEDGSERVFEYDAPSASFIAVGSEDAINVYLADSDSWRWSAIVRTVAVK